jgi:aryl-alcohol dehydrogenase-like predicted oxidoreductase
MAEGRIDSVSRYHLLGRSGLRVSPLCLGTMTFGNEKGWGTSEDNARQIFQRYLEAGGNFIDTADGYTGGESEHMLGRFFREMKNRDRLVVATKFTVNQYKDDPNGGGNSRKRMMEAVHTSLRRLQTEYIDLYWVHVWDTMTPVEETMSALNTLVQQGKIRYIGLSDVPAWYLARAQTLAEWRGWEPVIGLQLEYSLVERNIEREHVPAAQHLGCGICSWSPLGSGVLTGKYDRKKKGEGRLAKLDKSKNPVFQKLTDRNFKIVDTLKEVAGECGRSPAQVALNWITRRPGVATTIIGATKVEQLEDNLQSLEFELDDDLSARLEEISRPPIVHPYGFFGEEMKHLRNGENEVNAEPPWYR